MYECFEQLWRQTAIALWTVYEENHRWIYEYEWFSVFLFWMKQWSEEIFDVFLCFGFTCVAFGSQDTITCIFKFVSVAKTFNSTPMIWFIPIEFYHNRTFDLSNFLFPSLFLFELCTLFLTCFLSLYQTNILFWVCVVAQFFRHQFHSAGELLTRFLLVSQQCKCWHSNIVFWMVHFELSVSSSPFSCSWDGTQNHDGNECRKNWPIAVDFDVWICGHWCKIEDLSVRREEQNNLITQKQIMWNFILIYICTGIESYWQVLHYLSYRSLDSNPCVSHTYTW